MDYFRALKRKISSRLLSSNDLSSNIDVPQRLFPREITKIIFSYLRSPEELCSISRVCREWNEISSIDEFWKDIWGYELSLNDRNNRSYKSYYLHWWERFLFTLFQNEIDMVSNVNFDVTFFQNLIEKKFKTEIISVVIKIGIIGERNVGKSCVIKAIEKWAEKYSLDVPNPYASLWSWSSTLQIFNTIIKLSLIECSTLEDRINSYKIVDGTIIVSDLSNITTLKDTHYFLEEVPRFKSRIKMVVVGNKLDQKDYRIKFEMPEFAYQNFIEACAPQGTHIDRTILLILQLIFQEKAIFPSVKLPHPAPRVFPQLKSLQFLAAQVFKTLKLKKPKKKF